MSVNPEKPEDINEIFSNIASIEEKTLRESYDIGYALGTSEGNLEGFHLGYHRGSEVGAEIGYYTGLVIHFLAALSDKDGATVKTVNDLKKIAELLDNFPHGNAEDIDIIESLDNIRAKVKKICATLKIDPHYPKSDLMSF